MSGSGKAPSPPPSSKSDKTPKSSPSTSAGSDTSESTTSDGETASEEEDDATPLPLDNKSEPPIKSRPKFRKYEFEDFQLVKVLGKGSFGKVQPITQPVQCKAGHFQLT